ncbi:MAG: hypothetical protein V7676_03705 [Parasphingorhabdus sp.]|uniref:hypothetical protein n=1 Tax=Parasphingorhabdus sp. TaxID=2709688 RepID=UPI003002700B
MNKLSDSIEKARTISRERIGNAKELVGEGTGIALEKMSDSKRRAAELLGDSKIKAAESVEATKQMAKTAANRSEEVITQNPLAVLLGGLALGALVGALLPKSQTETKFVGGAGKKVNETAKKAYDAAKEAGQAQIETLGLNKGSVQDQIKDLLGKAAQAAKSAAEAASIAVKSDKSGK